MFDDASGEPAALVWHPYGLDVSQMAQLEAYAAEHNLTLRVSAESWYYPGHALRVELGRQNLRR